MDKDPKPKAWKQPRSVFRPKQQFSEATEGSCSKGLLDPDKEENPDVGGLQTFIPACKTNGSFMLMLISSMTFQSVFAFLGYFCSRPSVNAAESLLKDEYLYHLELGQS